MRHPLPLGDGVATPRLERPFWRKFSYCVAYETTLSYISGMQTDTLSLRISKSEAQALRARAKQEGVSQCSLVRRALRAYGITPDAEEQKTGYDVIKHVLGKNRGGPKDLSTNPKHLDDYGQ